MNGQDPHAGRLAALEEQVQAEDRRRMDEARAQNGSQAGYRDIRHAADESEKLMLEQLSLAATQAGIAVEDAIAAADADARSRFHHVLQLQDALRTAIEAAERAGANVATPARNAVELVTLGERHKRMIERARRELFSHEGGPVPEGNLEAAKMVDQWRDEDAARSFRPRRVAESLAGIPACAEAPARAN